MQSKRFLHNNKPARAAFRVGGWGQRLLATGAMLALGTNALAATIYVKWNATGANNGTSWTNAYTDLQDAMDAAVSTDQIWVAAGTYVPPDRTDPAQEQSRAFHVDHNGPKAYGGFIGTETLRSQRNPLVNLTYLSGDINGGGHDAGNSWHVVHIEGTAVLTITDETRIDGFIITGGWADGGTFGGNGGGILIAYARPVVQNCVFIQNYASGRGGAAHIAGIIQQDPQHILPEAGAEFRTCRFLNNTAEDLGGGMSMAYVRLGILLVNCVFHKNTATEGGGGLFIDELASETTLNVVNCTFANNNGGGFGRSIRSGENLGLANSVLWDTQTGSGAHVVMYNGAVLTSNDNNIQGDGSTLNSDPLYIAPAGFDSTLGTLDDNLRLECDSPSIDEGVQTSTPLDVYDVDDDGVTSERTPTADRRPRVLQAEIDQGAYETEDSDCPADIDGDGEVEVDDLVAVILGWGPCPPPSSPCPADVDSCGGSGVVDVDDLIAVILGWDSCSEIINVGGIPESYNDCVELCESASNWSACMQGCFRILCNNGHTEYCVD